MASWTSFGLLAVFCFFNVGAWSMYKECTVYEPGETVKSSMWCRFFFPSYESSYSGNWTTRSYCREYICSVLLVKGCTTQNLIEDSCCSSCPGYCAYGGRSYSIVDKFKCLDGINRCKCTGTGEITQLSKIPYSKETLCEPRHYGACSLYEAYEQKPNNGGDTKQGTCVQERINGRKMEICREYSCFTDRSCAGNHREMRNSAVDGCVYCSGTCSYAGRVVAENSTFHCIDGVNTCTCSKDGIFTQITSVKPTIDLLCKQYGKCKLYSGGQEKSETCMECRLYPWVHYAEICRDYTCATNDCSLPSRDNGCCPSCPGTCNYGGRVYQSGEDFNCMNGYDKCTCHGNGSVTLKHRWSFFFPFGNVCFSD